MADSPIQQGRIILRLDEILAPFCTISTSVLILKGARMKTDGRLSRGTTCKTLLLDAAVRIVAKFGANSLTHRAVAKDAHVSLASVTYHFPSSEALRSATYEYAGSQIGQELVKWFSKQRRISSPFRTSARISQLVL
jgi:DNA-binding transcriptional regulator YbjK